MADSKYEPEQNDTPVDEYKSSKGTKDETIPVVADNVDVEDPIDEATADSDETLARDDNEAIDKDNIIDERTRGAKPEGTYTEPADDEEFVDNSR